MGDVSCPYGLAVPVRPVDSRLDYCNAVRVTYSTEQYPPITAVQPHPLYHLHTTRNASAYRPLSTLPSNLIHSITYTRHAMYRRIGRYQHCRPTASTLSPTHTTPRDVSAYRPLSTLPSNRIHSITYTRHATRCIGVSAAIGVHNTSRFVPACRSSPSLSSSICTFVWRS